MQPSSPKKSTSNPIASTIPKTVPKPKGSQTPKFNITNKTRIIKASLATMSTALAHMPVDVSITGFEKENVPFLALHDTGCEKTIISKRAFDKICHKYYTSPDNKSTPAQVTKLKDCFISAYDGTVTPAFGTFNVVLTFKGINGVTKSYDLDVIVHEHTSHDIMIGGDFTQSPAKWIESTDYMYLVDEYKGQDITYPELVEEDQARNCCIVPIMRKSPGYIPIVTRNDICVLANESCEILCRTLDPMPTPHSPKTFEVTLISIPYCNYPNALYTLETFNKFSIVVTNHSIDDAMIPAGTPIGMIQLVEQDTKITPITVYPGHAANVFSVNKVAFIDEDSYLTEEEKLEAFNEFIDSGKHTPSMTSYVENTNTVTDFSVKDLTPIPFEQQFQLDHLSKADKTYALQQLKTVKKVFSTHDYDLGKAKDFEMTIEIDETKPRIQKYYPLPFRVRDEFRQALDQMVQYGIVRPCDEASLFCSNLLVTRRKNGLLRILLDGRLLNNATIRKPMSLVTNYETYAHLAKKQHVTVMDMSHSFYQIPLAKESQPYTAFFSEAHGKRFCFTRAPQGLKNSPLYLKLFTDKVLGKMSQCVMAYADDILIATDGTLHHHINTVVKVLKLLMNAGIKMRPAKINIATENVEFLGVIWNKGKLKIPEAKLLAFKNYPVPKTPKQIKSFLGALSYYRTFIHRFAQMAKPLMDLTLLHHKQITSVWTEVHQHAFDSLINAFINYTALNVPDPDGTFYVQTDASEFAAAGKVFQKTEDGDEKLIACVSRTFTKPERPYGIFRKETLALLYALKSLDFFLRFASRLVMLIDARAILFLRICKESAGILMRFSQELARYEAEIYHVPGKDNVVCDALSRNHPDINKAIHDHKNRSIISEKDTIELLNRLTIPSGHHFSVEDVASLLDLDSLPAPVQKKTKSHLKPGKRIVKNMPKTLGKKNKKLPATSNTRTTGVILPPQTERVSKLRSCASNMATFRANATNVTHQDLTVLCQIAADGLISAKCLAEAQKNDPKWSQIYTDLPTNYFLHDNVLMYDYKDEDKALIVLPTILIKPLLNAKHYTLFGVHHSPTRIARDIKNIYKVDKKELKLQLDLLKASCITCQFTQNTPKKHPFNRFDNITEPRTIWAVDLIPNMPNSSKGNSCIFLAIDMYTNYIQVVAIPNRSGPILKDAVSDCIIRPFGIPKYIRFDNEAGLENYAEFYKYCQSLRIEALPCSSGAPWSNGAAERAVQTIKQNLRKFVIHEQDKDHWDDYIQFVAMAHNSSLSVYGFSPEELHFGKTLPDRSDLIELRPTGISQRQYMNHIAEKADKARQAMRVESDKQNKRIMTYRNRNRSVKTFAVGDVVLKRQTQVSVGPNSAIRPKFTGPYHIDSIRPQQSSADIVHYRTGKTLHAHFTELQKLYHDQQYARLPDSFDSTMLNMLPDKYSRARYLASQPFDTQRPTPTQTQTQQHTQHGAESQHDAESQFGADSQFGAESQDGADISNVQDDFPDIPDDAPLYNFPDIDISNLDRNTVLDLSDINLEDHRVDRTQRQKSKSSQSQESESSSRPTVPQGPRQIGDGYTFDDLEYDPYYDGPRQPKDDDPMDPDDDDDPFAVETQSTFGDSQLPTYSQISTDDVNVTLIRDPIANFTITEYKNVKHPMCVNIDHLDPTQRVTELHVDPSVRPIKVKVITEPTEGMIEDIPAVEPAKKARKPRTVRPKPQYGRPRRTEPQQPASNPYARTYKPYARPLPHTRDTRSKSLPSQANNMCIFYFKPP